MPQVSIIIPNYNHAPFLMQRIDSVLNQTFQDFEVIILDDCSNDNSREIIEQYRNHSKVVNIEYNATNSGSTFKQWNKGISLAKGEYIWIAESDDWADDNLLNEAVEAFKSNHDIDIVYFKSKVVHTNNIVLNELEWWYNDLSKTKWKNSYTALASTELQNFLLYKNTIINASAVVFKVKPNLNQILKNIESFKKAGDWYFWLQYLSISKKIQYLTSATNYFRQHNTTTRASVPYTRNQEILKIYGWIVLKILNNKENWALAKYFFKMHLYLYPRRMFYFNAKLLLQTLNHSKFIPLIVLNDYFKFKKQVSK